MKKIISIVLLILLCQLTIVDCFGQSISRKVISTAGGILMGGGNQITFTIGETMNASLSASGNLITEGFEQPDEQPQSGAVLCYGSRIVDLVVDGGVNVKWYLAFSGGKALSLTSLLATRTYYFSQTINGIESTRTAFNVIINPTSIAGSITGASGIICYNSEKLLTLSATHRGVVQWQSAPLLTTGTFGTFTGISGNTGNTLNTGNLTESTYYRAVVTNGVCALKNTAPVKVVVQKQSMAGTITGGGTTLCPGINSTRLALSGYTGTIQWYSSADNVNFYSLAPYGKSSGYTVKNLTITSYFRAIVTKGSGCTPAITQTVAVNVKPIVNAGTITGVSTIPPNTSTMLTLSGYDLGATLLWKYSRYIIGPYYNGKSPSNISIYNTGTISGERYMKVIVTKDGCSSTTDPFLVTTTSTARQSEVKEGAVKTGFDVSIYPNPFRNTFMIDVNTVHRELIQISVYDMLGKRIEQKEVRPSEISLQKIGENYSSGIYNIILNQGTEIKTLRVIKQ